MPDLYSYDVERARGDDEHNLVTILMRHENLGLNEAIKWIRNYCSNILHDFLNDVSRVPSFGKEFQDDVDRYLDGLGNWVRAADCWSLESPIYFAAGGLEIRQHGKKCSELDDFYAVL
ncbi:hypothetical protein C0993_006179 [Termitomyces sp. T159_Od127]|nr:hypothetical protein C0993_006179 [Termitomyces sp. T159_Od127]